MADSFVVQNQITNVCSALQHDGQFNVNCTTVEAIQSRCVADEFRFRPCFACCIASALTYAFSTLGYANYSNLGNFIKMTPSGQRRRLVCPHHQVELRLWVFSLQLTQRIQRIGGAGAQNFALIDDQPGNPGKRPLRHFQPMESNRQVLRFVPCVAGGDDVQSIQAQLFYRRCGQSHVRVVRRVKRAAVHADTLFKSGYQTQSLLGKKSV